MGRRLLKSIGWVLGGLVTAFVIFWFARPADIPLEESGAEIPHQAESRFATIDGIRLHYQEKGEGLPLVLLHGFGSSTFTWKDVLDPLATRFRVIALDLMGFGFSDKPRADYSVKRQAELAMKLLDQLGVGKANICGNSMGGSIAIFAAATFPDRVSSLILIDAAAYSDLDKNRLTPNPQLLIPVWGEVLAAFAFLDRRYIEWGLRKSFYDPAFVTEERLNAYHRPFKSRNGQRAALATARSADLKPIEDRIHLLKVPVLILWGAEDEFIPLQMGTRLHRDVPGSKWVVFSRCGHLPQEEMPERVVEEIFKFIPIPSPSTSP